jgi:hypothetical protein
MSTREELRQLLLTPRPPTLQAVEIPELGTTFYVRVMTGLERDAYEAAILKGDKDDRLVNMRAKLVVRCTCDAEGKLLFTPEEVEKIGLQEWLSLDRLAAAAQKINAMTDQAIGELKEKSPPTLGDAQS